MSIGTPIDRVGDRGFRVTRRSRTGGNLAPDKGGSWVEAVLSSVEGVEREMDWKASLARHTWSILHAALYHVLGSVLASCLYGIVAIWFWMPNQRPH